jgi:predicted Zn finger-like uncharacterized protein
VVVVCEKCETRFHLDESRVPAEGAQVRCSRCTHAFFISAPGSAEADSIDEVVAEVTGPGETPVPDVASDLLDSKPEDAELDLSGDTESAELDAEGRSPGEFEEVWEFNDDSPAQSQEEAEPEFSGIGEFDASALDLAGEAPPSEIAADGGDAFAEPETDLLPFERTPEAAVEQASTEPSEEPPADLVEEPPADLVEEPSIDPVKQAPMDPVESIRARDAGLDFSSPDDLGSPSDWDFVGTAEAEPPLDLAPEDEFSESLFEEVGESGSALHSPAQADSVPGAAAAAEESERTSVGARFTVVGSIMSWVAVALAFTVGMSALFSEPGEGGAVSTAPAEIAVSGLSLTASQVEGRLVENALAGDLLVVSGELENRGSGVVTPGRPVWVQLVSASGVPIDGATAAVGRAVAETELREWDPDRLRRDLERSAAEIAQRPFHPGARIRFDAVFESVPDGAAGWVLQAPSSAFRPDPGISLPSTAPLAAE